MTFGKNDEAILAKSTLANRARNEIRQVDARAANSWRIEIKLPAHRLAEHDKTGSVMTRRRRSSISTDDDKSGLISLFIFDVFGEHTSPYRSAATRGAIAASPVDDSSATDFAAPAVDVAASRSALGRCSRGTVALRRCDRNGHHIADIGERCPSSAARHRWMSRTTSLVTMRSWSNARASSGEVDHALDRIFDRYETTIDLTRRDCVEHIRNSSHRNKFTVREVALSAKRLLGEGTEWAKERDRRAEPSLRGEPFVEVTSARLGDSTPDMARCDHGTSSPRQNDRCDR